MKMTAEDLFCIKHLRELGIDSSNFDENAKLLDVCDVPDFKMVKLEKSDFYEELAKQLRSMWPPGDKGNKYPWRDSVKNLKARLKLLWQYRQMKDYTLDECLAVARRYLNQFENDTRYMMLLKYFIMKQKSVIDPRDGKITYIQESRFADMLEGKSDSDALENEWDSILASASVGEGELV